MSNSIFVPTFNQIKSSEVTVLETVTQRIWELENGLISNTWNQLGAAAPDVWSLEYNELINTMARAVVLYQSKPMYNLYRDQLLMLIYS